MSHRPHSACSVPRFPWGPAGASTLAGLALVVVIKLVWPAAPVVSPPSHASPSRTLPASGPAPEWTEREFPRHPSIPKTVPTKKPPFVSALESALLELEKATDLQEQHLSDLLDWIAAGDLQAAITVLDREPTTPLRRELLTRLVRRWAETDPAAAAMASLELGATTRQEAIASLLPLWVYRDKEAARAWVNDLPPGEVRSAAQVTFAYEIAQTEPAMALELAMALPASPESDRLIAHSVMLWAASAPGDAAHWASQLDEPALRERLMATIATIWGNSDPVSAGKLAIESIPAGKAQADALVGIVQRWAQADPTAAATWVSKFPQGPLRTAAMENLTIQWGRRDHLKTGEWLNTLQRDASWDAAVSVYALGLAKSHRDLARSWAANIRDAQLRTAVINRLSSD